jgi:hypothetical protein
MREFQFVEKFQTRLERGSDVIFAHVLGRVMADAAFASEEQHADGHLRREHHRIVAGAARHPMGWRAGLLERAIIAAIAASMATDGWSSRGSQVSLSPRRVAISSAALDRRSVAAFRMRSAGWRTSSDTTARPGTTLPTPGSTAILPTVATSPDVVSASRSTSVIHAAADASASFRNFIGVVPACAA